MMPHEESSNKKRIHILLCRTHYFHYLSGAFTRCVRFATEGTCVYIDAHDRLGANHSSSSPLCTCAYQVHPIYIHVLRARTTGHPPLCICAYQVVSPIPTLSQPCPTLPREVPGLSQLSPSCPQRLSRVTALLSTP